MPKPAKIQPGDIIVPSNCKYPEGAIKVDYLFEGAIVGYPEGGGFQYRFDTAEQAKYNFRVVTEEELAAPKLRKGRFCIDDGKAYEGYSTGQRWNGWQMPFFEHDVCKQIVLDMKGHWSDNDEGILPDEYGHFTGDCDVIRGEMNKELGKVLYTFDGYCWDAVEES